MTTRHDVEFPVDNGITLRGWLYVPAGDGPHPAITMAHGYAGTREMALEAFACAFAEDGFAVLIHDHRNFGASDGEPRNDIDPWQQIADWRRAISFLEARPEVDPTRIGIWGTSFAGGHALVLGATDRRVRCVVSQIPTISGYEQWQRKVSLERIVEFDEAHNEDERAQLRGEKPRYQTVVSDDHTVPALFHSSDAIEFHRQAVPKGEWTNTATMRSNRASRMYEPGNWIGRVSPTPLLMIVEMNDTAIPADLQLAAYQKALPPKDLLTLPGGHFDAYLVHFEQSSGAAREWFRTHLAAK
ncbi:alpha/beta hydrolase [Saccharopolyspora sp. 5N708]|uniref:alpha/beta hydrolase n=1 Tax=Saccharopolyspora sp. 5N708 TaxID=3457424 RepID=UPI003FD2AE55